MQVQWEGEGYILDLDEMDTVEARYIKRKTELTPVGLQNALYEVDPEAMTAIYWLMMKQSGKPVIDIDRINIKIVRFAEAVVDAMAAEADSEDDESEDAEGDPKAK